MDLTDEPHVGLSLGLFALGALDATEREQVERHLADCDLCRQEADELISTAGAFAAFSDQDRHEIVSEFGLPRPAGRSLAPAAPPTAAVGAPPSTGRRLARLFGPGRVGRSGPPGRPAGSGPGRTGRHSGLLGVAGLAVVVLISIGLFVTLLTGGPDTGRKDQAVSLAATAGTVSGVSLSVVAIAEGDGVTVRATVTGLRADTTYRLYAVGADKVPRLVTTWVGSATAREVTGKAPVALSDLAFFSVTRADGTPVVSAAVPRAR